MNLIKLKNIYMKKFFAILFMLVAVVGLWSCNDDNTENDALYTMQLPGTWMLESGNEQEPVVRQYIFKSDGEFTYGFSSMNIKEATMKTWSVRGAWNVKKGKLQLYYDLGTLRTSGYNESEIKQMKSELNAHNDDLVEMNKKGRVYGATIAFMTVEGKSMLQLSGFNGYFEKMN